MQLRKSCKQFRNPPTKISQRTFPRFPRKMRSQGWILQQRMAV